MADIENALGKMFQVGPEPAKGKQEIQSALGRLVIEWNMADDWLRRLLAVLVGRQLKPTGDRRPHGEGFFLPQILTAELGSVGLTNALQAFVSDVLNPEVGAAVAHAAVYHERLRDYRNFFVHGIVSGNDLVDIGYVGQLQTVTAKAALVFRNGWVRLETLNLAADRCVTLRGYTNGVMEHINGRLGARPGEPNPPLPDKPPLPDILAKPGQHWRETLKRPSPPRPK